MTQPPACNMRKKEATTKLVKKKFRNLTYILIHPMSNGRQVPKREFS
jgi:hypothetical protein